MQWTLNSFPPSSKVEPSTCASLQLESLQGQNTVNCFSTSPLQILHVLSRTEVSFVLIRNFTYGAIPASLKMPSQNDVMRLGSKKTAQFFIV